MATEIVKRENADLLPALMKEVEDKIVEVRGQKTLLDRDVAALYGVETREVNQAVRNNPRKFLEGYVIELTKEESAALRSKLLTLESSAATLETLRSNNSTLEPAKGKGRYSKYNFKAFTRKGLYMLATCLKSDRAAGIITRGLYLNLARISFPFPLNLGIWSLSFLPHCLAAPIAALFGYGRMK